MKLSLLILMTVPGMALANSPTSPNGGVPQPTAELKAMTEKLHLSRSQQDQIAPILVAEADKKIVGFALGGIMKKPRNAWLYAWLEWLGVDPTVKRHGIATRLLNQLTTLFIKREARIILVDTDAGNYKALSFFRKNGFGHEIKHVYLSRNIDDHPLAIERKEALREDDEE